jgi:hypothetical protein
VLGFDVDEPVDLLSGRRFAAMGVGGAVEGDFFDWVLEDARGRPRKATVEFGCAN